MGSQGPDVNPGDGEGPVRQVSLEAYGIGRHAVTNREFAVFVEATGYRTGAERFGWSFVFAGFLPANLRRGAQRPPAAPWWCRVDGASWRHPEGPAADLDGRWERAARGGLAQATYAWGEELTPGGLHRCNIWQGSFPVRNLAEDGFAGTAPAETFAPNGFGLYEVAGNVWEWCANWWGAQHSAAPVHEPKGPGRGTARVMRGGSYLCHASYCNRYRVAARTSNDPDSAVGNLGFRVAGDPPVGEPDSTTVEQR